MSGSGNYVKFYEIYSLGSKEELEMEGSGSGKERTERERCCLFGLLLRNDVAMVMCSERRMVCR